MKRGKIIGLAGILICCLLSFRANGQSMPQNACDSIFMKALHDELQRSMDSLEDPESGKPCFISYSLLNGVLTNAEAVLGALTGSSSADVGDWFLRLMMGSYERNDENFVDPLASPDRQNQFEMPCPVEPDYWNIRKAFWWNTDNLFRSAAKIYKNKINAIREFPLDEMTEKLPDYTREQGIRISYPGSVITFPRKQTDYLVKELSAVFRNVQGIHTSEASLTALSSTVYIVNSEGSEIRIPLNLCLVTITVQAKAYDEEILSDNLSFLAPLVSSLPPLDTMKQAALKLGQYMLELKNAPVSGEKYYGPVLLYNQAVSGAFLSALFDPENSLIASREPLVYSTKKSMVPREKAAFENKLGKRILSKNLSVTALPGLEEYDGITLLGNVKVDAEGVVPPEEIDLVEDGILKNLLSDRVPTPKVMHSNGHHRMGVRMGSFTFQIAPSVIKISTVSPYSHDDLLKQLTSLAHEKGLEYAFILKPLVSSASYSPLCYYRLEIDSGKETLVRPLLLNPVSMNDLNKNPCMSDNEYVSNVLYGSLSRYGSTVLDGVPISMILPDAMVLEEVTLNVSAGNSGYGMPELE